VCGCDEIVNKAIKSFKKFLEEVSIKSRKKIWKRAGHVWAYVGVIGLTWACVTECGHVCVCVGVPGSACAWACEGV
jgi:hypothetical protein